MKKPKTEMTHAERAGKEKSPVQSRKEETRKELEAEAALSSLEVSDELAAAVQKTPNRVTLEQIEAEIKSIEFINPTTVPILTIAVVILKNGFSVVGKSACADPANFDYNLGRKFAREDAIRKIWPLMAFALCNQLTASE